MKKTIIKQVFAIIDCDTWEVKDTAWTCSRALSKQTRLMAGVASEPEPTDKTRWKLLKDTPVTKAGTILNEIEKMDLEQAIWMMLKDPWDESPVPSIGMPKDWFEIYEDDSGDND